MMRRQGCSREHAVEIQRHQLETRIRQVSGARRRIAHERADRGVEPTEPAFSASSQALTRLT